MEGPRRGGDLRYFFRIRVDFFFDSVVSVSIIFFHFCNLIYEVQSDEKERREEEVKGSDNFFPCAFLISALTIISVVDQAISNVFIPFHLFLLLNNLNVFFINIKDIHG